MLFLRMWFVGFSLLGAIAVASDGQEPELLKRVPERAQADSFVPNLHGPWPLRIEGFAGAQALRGMPHAGAGGDVGLFEGFLLSGPVAETGNGAIGVQAGAAFAQSNLAGSALTPDDRNRIFATGGIYRRGDSGWQGGVVCDVMHDNWYATSSAVQLRGETAWAFDSRNELGLYGTLGVSEDVSSQWTTLYGATFPARIRTEPIDLYGAFYRCRLASGGEARFFGGLTDSAQGAVSVDLRMPVSRNVSLDSGLAYLTPERDDRANGLAAPDWNNLPAEAWSFRVGLVFAFGHDAGDDSRAARPLFPVASDGTFFQRRTFTN